MSGGDRHERWSEDLAAYMLGALEPDEAAALERHLEECERCRAEMRWLGPAVRTLPEAVARQEPPPQLRASLMAEVRADAPRSAAPEPAGRRRWLPRGLRGDAGGRRLRVAAAFAAVALLVAAVAGYEVGKGGSGGGTSTVVSRQAGGVTAKMVREGEGATLQLADLRRLPPGKVLEAWVRRDGRVEPVPPLFVPDRAGRASTAIADLQGVDTVMVTEEPQGGSRAPTSAPIVTMSVPR